MLKQLMSFINAMGDPFNIDDIPMPENIEERLNIEYPSFDGLMLHLDIFKPKNFKQKTPVAIVIHGGGFAAGNQTMELPFSRKLSSKGVLVYSIDYRVVDECLVFDAIKDVIVGFDYVLDHLEEDNGDKNQIYVVSESAGVYASIYAQALCKNEIFKKWIDYKPVSLSIKGNVFISGMFYANKIDLVGMFYINKLFGKFKKDKELMRLMNPDAKEVLSVLPKSIFITSNYDFLESYTLQYQKVFNASNLDNLLLDFRGDKTLCHAFASLHPYLKESEEAMDKSIAYFKVNK